MELKILGKYGPFAKAGGATSSYLLQAKNKNILIDCGSGAISRLQNFISIEQINLICLSHLHFDHMSDMLTLRYALEAYAKFGKPLPKIKVFMPQTPENNVKLITDCEFFDVEFIEDRCTKNINGLEISFEPMTHPAPSYAMKFIENSKSFVYSGDTSFNDNIIPFAKNADMLLIDSAILSKDHKDTAPHLSVAQAAEVGFLSNAKQVLLTHIFPYYDENEILTEAQTKCKYAQIVNELTCYEIK